MLLLTVLIKSLIVLSVTIGSISIASFATVIGAPIGITSPCLSLASSKVPKRSRQHKSKSFKH